MSRVATHSGPLVSTSIVEFSCEAASSSEQAISQQCGHSAGRGSPQFSNLTFRRLHRLHGSQLLDHGGESVGDDCEEDGEGEQQDEEGGQDQPKVIQSQRPILS